MSHLFENLTLDDDLVQVVQNGRGVHGNHLVSHKDGSRVR